ncbi:hypothetical protein TKK_0019616 [Trichogramma kaykai]|uniref:Uricase n=1 Tax=Trichogramma kaykai TaxID=54128 RepID=A0ABD2VSD5_9HYME
MNRTLQNNASGLGWLSDAYSLSVMDKPRIQRNLISGHDKRDDFELGQYGYGKSSVKLLHVRRHDKLRHEIREYEIDIYLHLSSQNDYKYGDNRQVIATDSQKNTIYILAKRHGVSSPEGFAMLLTGHFLEQYPQVDEVNVNIEEYPWSRQRIGSAEHSHAFVMTPDASRFCQVSQRRAEPPAIRGGLKGLRLLKTTQSSFADFVQDDYRTLADANDRIFSTIVTASWCFSTHLDVDFDRVCRIVRQCIVEEFAGPAETGVYSSSVQNTLYLAERSVLAKVRQISSIEMKMPNKHYFPFDFSKFPRLVESLSGDQDRDVYVPQDNPSGVIYAQLNRKQPLTSSKL